MTDDLEELQPKVEELRTQFPERFKDNIQKGLYHPKDVERVEREDGLLRSYIRHQKGSVEKALQMIDTSFKWRKEMELNSLTEKSFPRELHEIGGVYFHNHDKDKHPILYFEVKKNKKDPEKTHMVKQFIAWWIDKHFLENPEERIVVFSDMSDAGFSNVDIDLVKFQITCFTTYYPALLAFMLIYEMPWVLNAIWKVIKTLLSAEQQKFVLMVKKNEIQQYIDKDQLWLHMGGTDDYKYTYLPSEDSGIDIPNGDVLDEEDNSPIIPKKKVTFSEKNQTMYTSFDGDSIEDEGMLTPSKNEGGSTPRSRKQNKTKQNTYKGTLATLCPAEQFVFHESVDGKEVVDVLSISNTASSQIAFKVKTTSPESYRVRPSTGLVKVGEAAEVNVFLQPGAQAQVARDKFLVMIMPVDDKVTSSNKLTDAWKAAQKDGSNYMEHRLWCTIGKASPPPPETGSMDLKLLQENILKLSQKMESMLENQTRLEHRLSKMFIFQLFIALMLVVFGLTLAAMYFWDYQPLKNAAAGACTPFSWHQ